MKTNRIARLISVVMALTVVCVMLPRLAVTGDKPPIEEAFIESAKRGDLAAVKKLLAEGADINGTDLLQRRALPCAAAKGHLEVVKLLIERGADVEATDQDCLTPLMNAAEQGRLEVAQLLLEKGANVNAQTKSGTTALRKAVNGEHLDVIRLLLDRGADVKGKLNDGTFILMSAAMTGNADIVKAILDKGANINARDDNGSSALTWAAFMDRREVVQLLRSRGAQSDLWIASLTGDKEAVERFLDAGADVNATDGLESTPLMYAAQKGHLGVAELLLERGADPAKRVRGRTAFDRGLSRVLGDMLLEKGIGILPKGSAEIVLVSACGDGRIDVVKHLLANGVDVNEGLSDRYSLRRDLPFNRAYERGVTPLMAACARGRIAVAKVLLGNGADVNLKDAKGYTALIHAAVNGELSALKFLLANGVDVDQRDANGRTALIVATSFGEMDSVKFLLANGADVNARDKHGYTALNMNCDGRIHDLLKGHGAKEYKAVSVGRPPLF